MSASAPALLVEDLHESFGALDVLEGVSLAAQNHDVISIIGSSGSGKSTFLRCINFLVTRGVMFTERALSPHLHRDRRSTAPARQDVLAH